MIHYNAGIYVQPFCLHLIRMIDKQYDVILAVQGWAYQMEGEGSQAETLPLAHGKNSNA